MYEWVVAATLVVTSLAAAAALYFTSQSVKATNSQLRVSEQGLITGRYNAAIANLGSRSIDIRLGGIYALQRLMQDSPRDQPTIIAVLCAFVRDRSMPTRKLHNPPTFRPPTDIQAAVTVVATRNTANDGGATVVDLDHAQLARGEFERANLTGAHLESADLTRADLTSASLNNANLTGANLQNATLTGANLTGADLTRAFLFNANLTGADFNNADLTGATLACANLTGASLFNANLTGAHLFEALWPAEVPVPKGWLRDNHSGRLKPTGTNAAGPIPRC